MNALTYRGHPAVTKEMFVADMADHAKADRLVAGRYDHFGGDNFTGCAIGCGIYTINRVTGSTHYYGDHGALAKATGWPLWLVKLEDALFEGLPANERKAWPEQLARAVPDGQDINPVLNKWLVRVLREIVLPLSGTSSGVVERVAIGLEAGWSNGDTAQLAAKAAWYTEKSWVVGNTARLAAIAAVAAAWATEGAASTLVQEIRQMTTRKEKILFTAMADLLIEELGRCKSVAS